MTSTTARNASIRQMLTERRRQIREDVQGRIRQGRTDRATDVGDEAEPCDSHVQADIEFALLQMKVEALTGIDQALLRLEAGKYGSCFECGGEIAERRLRALPFAVRCQGCEGRREQAQGRARQLAQRRGIVTLAPDLLSF